VTDPPASDVTTAVTRNHRRHSRAMNLSTEAKNGTWRLQVGDVYATDVGSINSWSIRL
jgi:subtilisin-like proprotein convertase family protein